MRQLKKFADLSGCCICAEYFDLPANLWRARETIKNMEEKAFTQSFQSLDLIPRENIRMRRKRMNDVLSGNISQINPQNMADFFVVCCSSTCYVLGIIAYCGKDVIIHSMPFDTVCKLARPEENSGRNVANDNFCISLALAREPRRKKLTLIGTIGSNHS